jgi:gliding motility-associated-like protein
MGPNQNLTNYSISFTYSNELGNTITSAELPNPFNTKTQSVTATIINNINTTCSVSTEIDFIVNPLPTFTVDDDTIVCLNLPPIPIGVTSAEAEYTYAWEHEDLNGNLSPFPSSGNTIFIGVGGTYFVTATTTDGTNCSRTLSIDVEESIIATITLDDITVEDLTSDNNNTITIDPTNLGIGDYEYAIDDPSGPYQNEPFFEGVRPGIHTIYIRDKNDCGIAQIDVSVIGYKKFFTPNGDGTHDTWRILGIREDFQPNSKVYIFDRYGKLLKDLDPITEGWDGTFIGRPMPQTDYWFRVFLEDGREFKGHFSLIRGVD